jgi:hypothetical protein
MWRATGSFQPYIFEVPPEPQLVYEKQAGENLHPRRIPGSHLQLGELVGWCWMNFDLTPHVDGERIVTPHLHWGIICQA